MDAWAADSRLMQLIQLMTKERERERERLPHLSESVHLSSIQEVHDCSPGAAQSAAHCSKCVHLDGLNAENTFHSSLYSYTLYNCVCDK